MILQLFIEQKLEKKILTCKWINFVTNLKWKTIKQKNKKDLILGMKTTDVQKYVTIETHETWHDA